MFAISMAHWKRYALRFACRGARHNKKFATSHAENGRNILAQLIHPSKFELAVSLEEKITGHLRE